MEALFPLTQYQNQGTCTQIRRVRTDKRKYFCTQFIVSLWNSLPHDVVMASDLDAFKRRLDRFLEEKSITGYKPWWGCIISRLRRKIPPNARCRGRVSGDRSLVVSCAPRGIWWGHCEIQEARLDGPLAWSSRALLMFLWQLSTWIQWEIENIAKNSLSQISCCWIFW